MLESLTPAAYRKWELFWIADPWGSWRDNQHTAIMAATFLRPHMRKGAQIDLDEFMVRDRSGDAALRVETFIHRLLAMSVPLDKTLAKRVKRERKEGRRRRRLKARSEGND